MRRFRWRAVAAANAGDGGRLGRHSVRMGMSMLSTDHMLVEAMLSTVFCVYVALSVEPRA